jgi:20S proteasome subunit beta 1
VAAARTGLGATFVAVVLLAAVAAGAAATAAAALAESPAAAATAAAATATAATELRRLPLLLPRRRAAGAPEDDPARRHRGESCAQMGGGGGGRRPLPAIRGGGGAAEEDNYDNCEGGANEVDLGTTIVAIKYRGGVAVGADARTSASGYVSNRFAQKVARLGLSSSSSTSACCWAVVGRSGSAADTQRLARLVRGEMMRRACRYFGLSRQFSSSSSSPPPAEVMPVSSVAAWLGGVLRGSGGEGLRASLVVAGYDPSSATQARIYSVAPTGAAWEEERYAAAGSGSALVMGYLDRRLRGVGDGSSAAAPRELDEAEAVGLCREAVELAVRRDGSSGGIARLCVCDARGVRDVVAVSPPPGSGPSPLSPGGDGGGSSSGAGPKELDGFAMPS